MNEWQINWLLTEMQHVLDCSQLKYLRLTLNNIPLQQPVEPTNLLELFISAKEVEGCSQKTIEYYKNTITAMSLPLVTVPCHLH